MAFSVKAPQIQVRRPVFPELLQDINSRADWLNELKSVIGGSSGTINADIINSLSGGLIRLGVSNTTGIETIPVLTTLSGIKTNAIDAITATILAIGGAATSINTTSLLKGIGNIQTNSLDTLSATTLTLGAVNSTGVTSVPPFSSNSIFTTSIDSKTNVPINIGQLNSTAINITPPTNLSNTLTTNDIVPTINNTYDIGTPLLNYDNAYFNNAYINNAYIINENVINADSYEAPILYLNSQIIPNTNTGVVSNISAGVNANITHINITTNVITVTCVNTFSIGQTVTLNSLVTATFLNGKNFSITAATGTSITGVYAHADYDTADTGVAGLTTFNFSGFNSLNTYKFITGSTSNITSLTVLPNSNSVLDISTITPGSGIATLNGILRTNTVDTISATSLAICPTNGTSVIITPSTTITGGILTNSVNTISATIMTIGTSATGVTVVPNLTCNATVLSNNYDSRTATTLTIGGGNATSVSIVPNTSITGSLGVISASGIQAVSIDRSGAGAFSLATVNATSVSISRTTILTTVNGSLTSTELFTATAGARTNNLDSITTTTLAIGGTNANVLNISRTGILTTVNGSLTSTQLFTATAGARTNNLDSITTTTLAIGGTNANVLNISRTGILSTVLGSLTSTELFTATAGARTNNLDAISATTLAIGGTNATIINIGNTTAVATLSANGKTGNQYQFLVYVDRCRGDTNNVLSRFGMYTGNYIIGTNYLSLVGAAGPTYDTFTCPVTGNYKFKMTGFMCGGGTGLVQITIKNLSAVTVFNQQYQSYSDCGEFEIDIYVSSTYCIKNYTITLLINENTGASYPASVTDVSVANVGGRFSVELTG